MSAHFQHRAVATESGSEARHPPEAGRCVGAERGVEHEKDAGTADVAIVTQDGGAVLEVVVIGTGPETEVRIARGEITEMRPGTVSVMPQGLDEQLSRQELADLVTFLKNTKWGVN